MGCCEENLLLCQIQTCTSLYPETDKDSNYSKLCLCWDLTGANECCAEILDREIRTVNCMASRRRVQISTVFINLADSKNVNRLTLVFMTLLLMHKQTCFVQKHRNLVVFHLSSSNTNILQVATLKGVGLSNILHCMYHPCAYISVFW